MEKLPDGTRGIPKSLERMLKVDGGSGANSTPAVPKSGLLAKLNAFLPELEAANKALLSEDSDKLNSIPAPVIVERAATANSDGEDKGENKDTMPNTDVDAESDAAAVHMDVYVNEELGELVPNADAGETEEAPERAMIEVLGEKKVEGKSKE